MSEHKTVRHIISKQPALRRRIIASIKNASRDYCFENPDISLFAVDAMGNYDLICTSKSANKIAHAWISNVFKFRGQEIRINGHSFHLDIVGDKNDC